MVNILGNNEVFGEYTFSGFENVLLEEKFISIFMRKVYSKFKENWTHNRFK